MTPEARRNLLLALCDFHRCPHTGRVIESQKGDDKALCNCGKPSPKMAAAGHREAPGTHIKAWLEPATVDEYIAQEEKRWASITSS